jgi:hypothetical protein
MFQFNKAFYNAREFWEKSTCQRVSTYASVIELFLYVNSCGAVPKPVPIQTPTEQKRVSATKIQFQLCTTCQGPCCHIGKERRNDSKIACGIAWRRKTIFPMAEQVDLLVTLPL